MPGPLCATCLTRNRPAVHFCTICGRRLSEPIAGDALVLSEQWPQTPPRKGAQS
jgi:hypothetical protein